MRVSFDFLQVSIVPFIRKLAELNQWTPELHQVCIMHGIIMVWAGVHIQEENFE